MTKERELFAFLSTLSIRNSFDCNIFCSIYDELGFEYVMNSAKKAKILPFIANASIICNKDVSTWIPIFTEYKNRNTRIVDGLSVIYSALEKRGVQKIFLSENFGALLSSGNELALFSSGDVDNCADYAESELISETMKSLGFEEERRYAGSLFISAEYTNSSILPEGFGFGVQWEPLARLTLPSFIHLNDFVDWPGLAKYSNTAIKLPPINALMYICLLHISLHSFNRAPSVRLYRDLVNCSKSISENDWNTILQWMDKHKTKTRVSTAAYIGQTIAGLSVPNEVLVSTKKALLDVVLDEPKGILKKEPGRFSVLLVESLCNDYSILKGIKDIVFPNKEWVKQVYGVSGFLGTIKHLKNIL